MLIKILALTISLVSLSFSIYFGVESWNDFKKKNNK